MPAPTSRAPGWRLGTISGAPVYLGRSWPVIAIVIVFTFGPQVEGLVPGIGAQGYLVALLYAVLLLISVLVHEVAHAVVGTWCGYRVQQIMADLWGGHTMYDSQDSSAGTSALVSVVGPVSNAILALLAWFALPAFPSGVPSVPRLLILAFIFSNGFVALFNVLPGLPLDGGYVLQALVWKVTGSRSRGTWIAAWCGRVICVLLIGWAIVWPLLHGRRPSLFTVIWCVVLAGFLWVGAGSALQGMKSETVLQQVRVGQVTRPVPVVPEHTPVGTLPAGVVVAVVDAAGQLWGVAEPAAHHQVPPQVPISALAQRQPAGWVCQVPGNDSDVTELVRAVQRVGPSCTWVFVLDPANRPLGLCAVSDLDAALRRVA